ncbi:MAG: 50S ribosomal protein L4 [Methanocellales archaeon]|nr:50S ribosomal protein L4 [Methanocellales archaeon]MDD3421098.1 50S ribosomal protein L4 [Methanocellales archaeon]MDD4898197.1 50S ribosomal protein L4 [Methanocellales archaeon]MDD5446698.1 50S ribosomal protein L4 [Methanocellales archaeon]
MEAQVIDLTGNVKGKIELPKIFDEAYRPDLIKKAVIAAQANRLQPYGPDIYAGMRTSAESWGVGRGVSRAPRIKDGRRVAIVSFAVGGRRAHPPKVQKILSEKINKKERRKAIRSAIAATANPYVVKSRGYKFDLELPIVIEDSLEELTKASEMKEFLQTINLWDDVLRAKNKKIRAGKGKMRGRKYKRKKSILLVISEDKGIVRAARNLPGMDAVLVDALNAELLAPGANAGRLTIWTESSISKLEEVFK